VKVFSACLQVKNDLPVFSVRWDGNYRSILCLQILSTKRQVVCSSIFSFRCLPLVSESRVKRGDPGFSFGIRLD